MPLQLFGANEFSKILVAAGFKKWTRHYVSEISKRSEIARSAGTKIKHMMPEPFAYVGNRPAWTIEQIEKYKDEMKD